MSWTDTCRVCDSHRADCECEYFDDYQGQYSKLKYMNKNKIYQVRDINIDDTASNWEDCNEDTYNDAFNLPNVERRIVYYLEDDSTIKEEKLYTKEEVKELIRKAVITDSLINNPYPCDEILDKWLK